jgi:hypothetical protein
MMIHHAVLWIILAHTPTIDANKGNIIVLYGEPLNNAELRTKMAHFWHSHYKGGPPPVDEAGDGKRQGALLGEIICD